MVDFNNIPSNIRVPLFYAEMDNSMAGTFTPGYRALLIGQALKADKVNQPQLVMSEGAVIDLAGNGSMLHEMFKAYRKNDTFMELWALPLPDIAEGVQAAGTITVAGAAQENGVLSLYIGGTLVQVNVVNGDSSATVAEAIAAGVYVRTELPATAAVEEGAVTLTCKWAGLTGNDLDVRLNYLGELGGQSTPRGLTVTITAISGGSGIPVIDVALANLGDSAFDYIALPYSDAASLNALQLFMDDSTGRWSWQQQLYGHVFCLARRTLAQGQTLGASRNDQHASIMSYYGSPSSPWEITAMLTARAGASLSIDPARPLQTLELTGMLAPDVAERFSLEERNTLLYNGISTFKIESGGCLIERVITTRRKDGYSQDDNSYLDVQTLATSAYVLRNMRQVIQQKYGRHKLANDGTRFGSGASVVTPNAIRAELIALYSDWEAQGLVENADLFARHLIVERDANDPNRVNVLFPPDYVNQLRIFAVRNQFRLQY